MRNMTKRRRYLLISSEKTPRVPEGYKEVEWLRGSGSQWCSLDGGIGLTSDNHFYGIKGDIEKLDGTRYSNLVIDTHAGRASQIGYTYWRINASYSSLSEIYHPQDGWQLPDISLGGSGIETSTGSLLFHFEINKTSMKVNSEILNNPSYPSGSYIGGIVLGARQGTDDSRIVENSNVLIKSIKLTYDDVVYREYIPCVRESDSKAGLFYWIDHSQGTSGFITNSGSGSDWIYGPEV